MALGVFRLALATLDTQFPEQVVGVGVARQVPASFGVAHGFARRCVGNTRLERQPVAHRDLLVKHPDRVTRAQSDLVENSLGFGLQIR